MKKVFSQSAQQVFLVGHHQVIPEDALPMSDEEERELVGNRPAGVVVIRSAGGEWVHSPAPEPDITAESLCVAVDLAADEARSVVVGAPLRDEEYKLAAQEARAFADGGFSGEVPRTVAAWAINGRTPQQAAESILAEAEAYTDALCRIRAARLSAKESIRGLVADGDHGQAKLVAEEAIRTIQAAVIGVGNNRPQAA